MLGYSAPRVLLPLQKSAFYSELPEDLQVRDKSSRLEDHGLSDSLVSRMRNKGFTSLFPIQVGLFNSFPVTNEDRWSVWSQLDLVQM